MRPVPRVAASALLTLLSLTTLVAACQLVNGLDSLRFVDVDGGSSDARPDMTAHDAARSGPCVFDGHASLTPMIAAVAQVGETTESVCIDRTEVTFEQFTEFTLDAALPIGAACGGLDLASLRSSDSCETPPDSPVTLVPWCGAVWYCGEHHRQLCAGYEWAAACRGATDAAYPYGDTFEPGRCNVDGPGPGPVPWERGSCQGGTPGLFDMVGNVAEWVVLCTGTSPDIRCAAVGGGYDAGPLGCPPVPLRVADLERPATTRDSAIGFRCCAPYDAGCP
jgi:hypothetical protein